jgi:hypothetical protein
MADAIGDTEKEVMAFLPVCDDGVFHGVSCLVENGQHRAALAVSRSVLRRL